MNQSLNKDYKKQKEIFHDNESIATGEIYTTLLLEK